MQKQLSFLKPSADIWDSGQLALYAGTGSGMEGRGVLDKPRAQWEGWLKTIAVASIITVVLESITVIIHRVFHFRVGLELYNFLRTDLTKGIGKARTPENNLTV